MLPVIGLRLMDGRLGSTLTMQLLATSPRIVFDRTYPFGEYRYLAYCSRMADVIARQHDPEHDRVTPFFFSSTDAGPMPWQPLELDRSQLGAPVLRSLWEAYSNAFLEQNPEARYYAEKLVGDADGIAAAGIPVRIVDLVRDPRDVLASIRAFTARGIDGFGRTPDTDEGEYLQTFIGKVRGTLERLNHTYGCERLLIRYEDLATDLAATAARLGDWIGEELDANAVLANRADYAHHITSDSAEASIGRWRDDLSAADADTIWSALEAPLLELGYERDGAPPVCGGAP